MQSTYVAERSLYTNLVNYIRKLRDEPNTLDGVRFAGYTDNADAEYIENIRKYFVEKRYRKEFPKEIGTNSTIANTYTFTPKLKIRENSGFNSAFCVNNNNDDFAEICAWALAYITAGNKNSIINKERYLNRAFSAMQDYEKKTGKKLRLIDKIGVLHNTNKCMGLESYLFRSEDRIFVLMEAEIKGVTGLRHKSYVIVNNGSFANVIFGDRNGVKEEYPVVSQIDLSVEDTQRFVDGELSQVYNYKRTSWKTEIEMAKDTIYSKFNDIDINDLPEIRFEDAYGNSTDDTFANDYCFTVYSPARVMTR